MRVLQLCSKVPYPAKDGGCLAMLNLATLLQLAHCEVKMLCMATHKHPFPDKGFPETMQENFAPEALFIDTKPNAAKALLNLLFSKNSYHLERFYSTAFEKKLIELLHNFKPEIVVLDSLFVGLFVNTIRKYSNAKIVYRAHNIEHLIWQETAYSTKNWFKKTYLNIQSKRLKKEEFSILTACDAVAAITDKDVQIIAEHFPKKRVLNLPFTLNSNEYPLATVEHTKNAVFFIGAMDWFPNLDGIHWFIENVWDKVLAQEPNATFYLAGRAMPNELKHLSAKNIINLGEVTDAQSFMNKANIMVAPIFSGGGLKVKLVEAMALGKTVICNTGAAFGIPATSKKDILFAATADEFVKTILWSFAHSSEVNQIGNNARVLIQQHFDTHSNAVKLENFLQQTLR